jgi:hypothetical protein
MSKDDYNMVMPFINQSHDFTHGFECGQIWEQMKMTKKFDNYLFHVTNKEQVEMMCKRNHYTCSIEIVDDTWCYLTAEIDLTKAN